VFARQTQYKLSELKSHCEYYFNNNKFKYFSIKTQKSLSYSLPDNYFFQGSLRSK